MRLASFPSSPLIILILTILIVLPAHMLCENLIVASMRSMLSKSFHSVQTIAKLPVTKTGMVEDNNNWHATRDVPGGCRSCSDSHTIEDNEMVVPLQMNESDVFEDLLV